MTTPAPAQYFVQSKSTAGPDRVNVSLVLAQNDTAPGAGGANLNLNLPQAEADLYEVNSSYTLTLTKV